MTSPTFELPPTVANALSLIAERLAAAPELPWMLAGDAAAALQGVAFEREPSGLLLLTGAPELARVVALLAADEREPLASRPAPGYAAGPRGRYELGGVAIEVVGDARPTGGDGTLSLSLERVWHMRAARAAGNARVALLPLEIELAVALLQGRSEQAYAIADFLLAQGVRWEQLGGVLEELPALEQPLWDLMDQVRPLAKRARSRRARQQLGWGQGKKKRK